MRLLLCYLGGVVLGWGAAMCLVMPLVFFTSIDPNLLNMLAFVLGMGGGCAGAFWTMNRWGAA